MMHPLHTHIIREHADEPAPRRSAPERLDIRPQGLLILPGVIPPPARPPDQGKPAPQPAGPSLIARFRSWMRAPAV